MRRIELLTRLAVLLIALFLLSCHDENRITEQNCCNVTNPLEELVWLKTHIQELSQSEDELSKYSYYMTATYKKETVFYYGNCHPAINMAIIMVNCEGEALGNFNDLQQHLSNSKLIWIHEESPCNFND